MELFMLLTPKGHLYPGSILQTLEEARKELTKEYPPGVLIFPGYKVVRVRLQIMEAY